MNRSSHIFAAFLLALAAGPAAAQDAAPYAGLESREIKALSPERIEDLLAGEGMGYALAAELNHYPGRGTCSPWPTRSS